MRRPRCTIDTSCVIALDYIGRLPLPTYLFDRVLLPKGVRSELSVQRTRREKLRSLLDQYAFFEKCDDYEHGAVFLLRREQDRLGTKDRGEAEAVVQAAKIGAAVVVDDQWGREKAMQSGLDVHGTMWILERFYELRLLSSAKFVKTL